MKFSFEDFDSGLYEKCMEKLKSNEHRDGDFVGAIRVGDLCFDLVAREYKEKMWLDYDLYVGGVDTGYGYAEMYGDYPYDHADGGTFKSLSRVKSYEGFVSMAKYELEKYIRKEGYGKCSLTEKAEMELHYW